MRKSIKFAGAIAAALLAVAPVVSPNNEVEAKPRTSRSAKKAKKAKKISAARMAKLKKIAKQQTKSEIYVIYPAKHIKSTDYSIGTTLYYIDPTYTITKKGNFYDTDPNGGDTYPGHGFKVVKANPQDKVFNEKLDQHDYKVKAKRAFTFKMIDMSTGHRRTIHVKKGQVIASPGAYVITYKGKQHFVENLEILKVTTDDLTID